MNKNWGCPKKIQARRDTIIERYPFGEVKQYWSMSGLCIGVGCEIHQMVTEGFIDYDQFHGVDRDQDNVARNAVVYPYAHWLCDDFYRALSRAQTRPGFAPSVVNADLTQMAEFGAPYIASLLNLLSTEGDVMLVSNFVLKSRWHSAQAVDGVIDELEHEDSFHLAMQQGWEFDGQPYLYEGTGNSASRMATFVFTRAAAAQVAAA